MAIRLLLLGALLFWVSWVKAAEPARGQVLFKQCLGCHAIGPGAKHLYGPQLNGVFERPAGSAVGYQYSQAFQTATDGRIDWSDETLDQFLASPQNFMPGTKMVYPGVGDERQRADLIAYLRDVGSDGVIPVYRKDANKKITEKIVPKQILPKDVPVPEHGVLHLGRIALESEISAWDIDIRPDGLGLPVGAGSVLDGVEIYDAQCAACHGVFGEGAGRWPVLAGGHDTLTDERPEKTIGSYWPYLSTVFDYIRRAMPFGNARSLTDDDVYALTAYLLYLNDLVEEDFVLNADNFSSVRLPNEQAFIDDDRAEEPHYTSLVEPCMTDCTDGPVEIVMRARVLDVTPDSDDGDEEFSSGSID